MAPMRDVRVMRKRIHVSGIVQGVGFRPFVYSLANGLDLSGIVFNDTAGVVVEIEGDAHKLRAFSEALVRDAPPLASIEHISEEEVTPQGSVGFEIKKSDRTGARRTPISADVATCAACLKEILDPGDRRFRYPFTNCTNCGPRFTITTAVPYDRPNTTMSEFAMCSRCKAEYEDARDRRFHAQPIACPACGPSLRLLGSDGSRVAGDPLSRSVELIRGGAIVAVKGLGGYHLACDATNDSAVAALRRRKGRDEKPFAVMVPTLEWTCRIAHTTPEETSLIASRRRPIVLVAKRDGNGVADAVAPGNRSLGLMLPYTPLHYLLLAELGSPVVLTSGNLSEEPIAYRDDEALRELTGVADAFLIHDRRIHMRCDDSVVRVVGGRDYPLRRARGYAPEPLVVDRPFTRPVLASGAELKHTFCLGADDRAILSHHIGDLENWETMSSFVEAVEHFTRTFDVRPEVVAHDLHPEYLSTKWAVDLEGVERIGVQHHHAHIASCLADNWRSDRVIGLALDGTGYGDDGALWGCEVLAGDLQGYRRAFHLHYVPLPGGAEAIKEPWRMAAVYLNAAFGAEAGRLETHFTKRNWERAQPILHMAERGLNSPPTSSAGRLFDAVAALCGLRDRVAYEGQAAVELEQAADPSITRTYPCSVADGVIDGVELVAAVVDDLSTGTPVPEVAAAFHASLARSLVTACELTREEEGLNTVALSGGTFQNALLLRWVREHLERTGFEVLTHHRVPPNDGGISLGQAVIANARLAVSS